MSSNNSELSDDSESAPRLENNVYSDVLTKLRSLRDKSEKKDDRRSVLNDGVTYMTKLIELIERHKNNQMSQETALLIDNGFMAFLQALTNISINELFQNDSAYAYEMFYKYMQLLNLTGMKNYLKQLQMNVFVKTLYGRFTAGILHVTGLAATYAKFTVADLNERLDNQETFLLMLSFIKAQLDSDSSSTYPTTTQLILCFIWNYADKTVVVPNLIKVGYSEAALKWLSTIDRPDVIRPLISIIHNTSRHDDGINILNSLDAINVIKKVQSETENSEINILSCMTLALLSTSEQIKNDRKHMNNALDQLLQSVSDASKSKEYKYGGFHISEPLVVLVKLFNDDRALDYILQHAQVELDAPSTIDFFINLLLQFNNTVSNEKDPLKQLTCTALVNILWSVSFQEHYRYKRHLQNNQYLMTLLEKFSDNDEINETTTGSTQYVPKYIESIQTAAKGILLNISEKTPTVNIENHSAVHSPVRREPVVVALVPQYIPTEQSVVGNNKPMIMISYSHDDKALCYQLEDELKRSEQYDIWIDKNYCAAGDSWEHIARGIKQSQVVLCLITKNYTSKSVRREVIYAIDRLDKPLVPVFVLKPDIPEWLDIRTCDLTHVRFTDDKQLERPKISKLIETLQKLISGSNNGSDSAPVHHDSAISIVPPIKEATRTDRDTLPTNISTTKTTSNLSQKPVDQWNKADIEQWFHENGIISELCNLCQFNDGSELLNYAKILLEDEKSQYTIYAAEFPKVYDGKTLLLHQFNKFSNALRKLSNEQEKRAVTVKPIPTVTAKKSQTCQIL